VVSRGVDHRAIFERESDRRAFLSLLGDAVAIDRVRCLNYCLMGNHFHLVLRAREEPFGDVMRDVISVYARRFNGRFGREGCLFERRYWARHVTTERDMAALTRYVARNPVRAGLCASPEAWPWSAHGALLGTAEPGLVDVDAALAHFGNTLAQGRAAYRALVATGASDVLDAVAVTIERDARNAAMRDAHAAGYTVAEIARAADCHAKTVRRALRDKLLGGVCP
jgi:REP element-mobilizing transposase RayT